MAFSSQSHSYLSSLLPSTSKPAAATTTRRSSSASVRCKMAATTKPEYEEGNLEMPKWAGETPLSRLVGAMVSFKPLYSLLKLGARQVLISTAEKRNIQWREMTRNVLESDVYKEMDAVLNPSLQYPDYYLSPFHAYDEGNLSWLAAAEAEPATMSMVFRAVPDASTVEEANEIVRGNWLRAIENQHQNYSGGSTIRDILDVGCSVGVSTRFLADKFPSANVTGLDLSPYFLSVAKFKEKNSSNPRKNIVGWIHANGEHTGLPDESFDVVSISLVFHECPERAIVAMVNEAFRLLRPGGTIALMDQAAMNDDEQELSPVLFTLLKSTEPYLDEFYLTDLNRSLKEAGFVNIQTVLSDSRHMTMTATVPVR
ncbi:Demethylmenaquinone methyltransferase [Linum perenne]